MITTQRRRKLAHVLLVVVYVIFGVWNHVAASALSSPTPAAAEALSPAVLAMARDAGAAAVMVAFAVLSGVPSPSSSTQGVVVGPLLFPSAADTPSVLLMGTAGVFMAQALFTFGLSASSPLHAALLQPLTPVVMVGLTSLLNGDPCIVSRAHGSALALASAGALAVVIGGASPHAPGADEASGMSAHWLGSALLLGAIGAFCLYLVCSARILGSGKYPCAWVTAWAYAVGAGQMMLFAMWWENVSPLSLWAVVSSVSLSQAGVLAYGVFLATAFNYNALSWASSVLGSRTVSLYNSVTPLTAAALSPADVTLVHMVGGALICLGLGINSSLPVPTPKLLPTKVVDV